MFLEESDYRCIFDMFIIALDFRSEPSVDIEKVAALFQKFKIQGLLIIGGFEVRKYFVFGKRKNVRD